jgi:hypothetical protein
MHPALAVFLVVLVLALIGLAYYELTRKSAFPAKYALYSYDAKKYVNLSPAAKASSSHSGNNAIIMNDVKDVYFVYLTEGNNIVRIMTPDNKCLLRADSGKGAAEFWENCAANPYTDQARFIVAPLAPGYSLQNVISKQYLGVSNNTLVFTDKPSAWGFVA